MSTSEDPRDASVGDARRDVLSCPAIATACTRVAQADCTVLLTGETGVGKGFVARWMHERSPRVARPMVPVNCGAIPESLIDSQLFGHARGAYTGADRAHSGLVRAADGGTLLLDEVSELPMHAQVRLLRVLEEREVLPVGESRPQQVDVRIVASTNADLAQRVRDGRFREDLYYRLNVIQLEIPPLRERPGEIDDLFHVFNGEFAELYKRPRVTLSREARSVLVNYDWPGNVRELRIVTERLHVLCPETVVTASHLHEHGQVGGPHVPALQMHGSGSGRTAAMIEAKPNGSLTQRMQQARLSAVRKVLAECGGNVSSAARTIGVHRSTLYRWLQDAQQCA